MVHSADISPDGTGHFEIVGHHKTGELVRLTLHRDLVTHVRKFAGVVQKQFNLTKSSDHKVIIQTFYILRKYLTLLSNTYEVTLVF